MGRAFILAGAFAEGLSQPFDFLPIPRLDGIEEGFNFGRNRLLSATRNRPNQFTAGSAKLADLAGDDLLRGRRRRREVSGAAHPLTPQLPVCRISGGELPW